MIYSDSVRKKSLGQQKALTLNQRKKNPPLKTKETCDHFNPTFRSALR